MLWHWCNRWRSYAIKNSGPEDSDLVFKGKRNGGIFERGFGVGARGRQQLREPLKVTSAFRFMGNTSVNQVGNGGRRL